MFDNIRKFKKTYITGVRMAVMGLMISISAINSDQAFAQTANQSSPVQAQAQPQATSQLPTEPAEQSIEKFGYAPEKSTFTPAYQTSIGFMNSFSVLDKKGRVKIIYDNVRTTGTAPLLRSLRYLRDVPVSQLNKNDQLAYWLNLRNMLIIFAITSDRATDLNQERGTLDNPGPLWTAQLITVEGVGLSIDDIERKIILKHWRDPNIIYGLYQGVKGGPSLYKPGFNGSTVNRVLPKLGKRYLSDKRNISVKSATVNIPEFYRWYSDVFFKGEDRRILAHLRKTSQTKLSGKLQNVDKIRWVNMDYQIDDTRESKTKRATTKRIAPAPQLPRGGNRGGGGRRSGS